VAARVGQVEVGGAHGVVVTSAVQHQVELAVARLLQRLVMGLAHGRRIGHVQRQGDAAGVIGHEGLQRAGVACGHDDLGPAGV